MGVQIRVGYNDHQLVADFLANDPSGVSAITIDAKLTKRHRPAMEAARDAGITVLVETLTDRLAFAGYDPGPLDYADSYPLGRTALDTFTLRARFVESVVEPQAALGLATVTAPHFFADSADELRTNVELARLAVHEYAADQRVKAVCAVSRSLLAESNAAREAAELYGQAGVSGVELRLSPLGGAHESVQKIKATFDTLRAFGEFNVPVTLGYAGLIGEVAYALGLAEAFSTGVGDRERYDFKGAIANQKRLSTAKRSGEKRSSRGSPRRVLLPVAGLQVPRELARTLYSDPGIRARLACRVGPCADSIEGPLRASKVYYLHSRAESVRAIDRLPPGWRGSHERDRMQRAIELCTTINEHHLSDDAKPLPTRTLESLRSSLDQMWPKRSTA